MLGYCTNVHSGVTFSSILENLKTYSSSVQQHFKKTIGVGLWFSDIASREVDTNLLVDTLQELNLQAFTINGFPFSNFHQEVVRHSVYEPNWSKQSRLDYTIRLADILSKITMQSEACISTLPLGWNTSSFTNDECAVLLHKCIDALEEIEQQSGKNIHIGIETEPGCRLQRSQELCDFVCQYFGDDERSRKYIRVCHDTCHGAVMRESAEDCVKNYINAGLRIGKVQLSSALKCDLSAVQNRTVLTEPKFLHQTTVANGDEVQYFEHFSDIPASITTGDCRIHFHVPIHLATFGELQTTQIDLIESIRVLKSFGVTDWEVETYTWSVTPSELKDGNLVNSITKELTWATKQLNK